MKVNIAKAAKELGVCEDTLRRWEKAGKIEVERTPRGHRRYDLAKLRGLVPRVGPSSRITLAYARVSSHDQKEDLTRQVALLESFAVEDLSGMRGRTKSRKLSRIVSRWARSHLRERLEFRTQAGGSRLETVSAAYTSQTCSVPTCGYVHKDNRHGDRFHCLECGWDGDADAVAGMNLLARVGDPEIHLWTPRERIKAILDERFRRRKEALVGDRSRQDSSITAGASS